VALFAAAISLITSQRYTASKRGFLRQARSLPQTGSGGHTQTVRPPLDTVGWSRTYTITVSVITRFPTEICLHNSEVGADLVRWKSLFLERTDQRFSFV